jgi:beta-phosphoglucomutase-like phosphatase (HAD superfamily)
MRERLPTAVFTGASRRAAQIILSQCGLLESFKTVVGGDEVARPKPRATPAPSRSPRRGGINSIPPRLQMC